MIQTENGKKTHFNTAANHKWTVTKYILTEWICVKSLYRTACWQFLEFTFDNQFKN